jgi:hypothetical protein
LLEDEDIEQIPVLVTEDVMENLTPVPLHFCLVVPIRKIHALTITWALPPQQQHYR